MRYRAADSGRYYVEITNNLNGEATVKQSTFCVLTVSDEPAKQLENLIAGKPYATSLKDDQFHSSSPDKERKQLTDGIHGQSWGDGNTVGYFVPRGRIADIASIWTKPSRFLRFRLALSAILLPVFRCPIM